MQTTVGETSLHKVKNIVLIQHDWRLIGKGLFSD